MNRFSREHPKGKREREREREREERSRKSRLKSEPVEKKMARIKCRKQEGANCLIRARRMECKRKRARD
jgi:hypothetical protein